MAQSFSFERPTDDDLIVISAQLNNSLVDFVLDTGASHTFVDFGVLIKEGYRKSDTKSVKSSKSLVNQPFTRLFA